jgi:5'-deoxynucleotidase YfbR-like HD superfamily hydrolase
MNPLDQYKNNSKLPQSNEDINKANLSKIISKIEMSIVMERPDTLRKTISTLFDYINFEDNSDENNPVFIFTQILYYLYNNCEKDSKESQLKLIRTIKGMFE